MAMIDRSFFRRAQEAGAKDLTGHSKKVHTVAWSCDGKRLASGSVDKTVNVWRFGDSNTGTLDQELKGHTDVVDRELLRAPRVTGVLPVRAPEPELLTHSCRRLAQNSHGTRPIQTCSRQLHRISLCACGTVDQASAPPTFRRRART